MELVRLYVFSWEEYLFGVRRDERPSGGSEEALRTVRPLSNPEDALSRTFDMILVDLGRDG